MASVALLSNPRSTGNRALLPRVREYCAAHPDIFHYEVEDVDQIGEAIRTIAMVSPRVVVINGGDGTVQAALTAAGLVPDLAEVTMRAENTVELSGEEGARMQRLLDIIEDLDDVQDVFHNASITE